jgi:hypothetical protein
MGWDSKLLSPAVNFTESGVRCCANTHAANEESDPTPGANADVYAVSYLNGHLCFVAAFQTSPAHVTNLAGGSKSRIFYDKF